MDDEQKIVVGFSRHLKRLRRQKELTQEELAERANISYKNIQYLESSKPTCPSLITLHKLAKGLNLSLHKLLNFRIKS